MQTKLEGASRGEDGAGESPGSVSETDVPARLDRLPWSRWHWLVLIGLGTVWILDGFEVTIVGAIGSTITKAHSGIAITTAQIGDAAGVYIAGACAGALLFGYLTDRFGRKRLFLVTLGLYLAATLLTAASFNVWWFFIFRFLTGMGIGGEYSAINSAIDELIPARVRGTVDLLVNGSYWLGTAAGAAATLVLLDPKILAIDVGWRLCFGIGAVLGIAILIVRRLIPESPRWLFTHGRPEEADVVVASIERQVGEETGQSLEEVSETVKVRERDPIGFIEVGRIVFGQYPRRSVLGLALFIGQAFLYNAVFFTYALVLTTFYKVNAASVGLYLIAFAVGNFAGPLLLGRLFDTVGRRKMIAGTYLLSGVMLGVTAALFNAGTLSATTQTIAWVVVFFFASAGASVAYLTVSEIFPMETRALAIAFFYAIGTGLGGIIGPVLFGALICDRESFGCRGRLCGRRGADVRHRHRGGLPRRRRRTDEPRGHCHACLRPRARGRQVAGQPTGGKGGLSRPPVDRGRSERRREPGEPSPSRRGPRPFAALGVGAHSPGVELPPHGPLSAGRDRTSCRCDEAVRRARELSSARGTNLWAVLGTWASA